MTVFAASPVGSLGVELELQIVDANTLDLADRVEPLIAVLPAGARVKREFFQSCVELVTDVRRDLAEAEADLAASLAAVQAAAARQGLAVCGGGTHPFCRHLSKLTDDPRYRHLAREAGAIARRLTTFSLHVHCGMRSGEEAIAVMERVRRLTPVFVALSANSPRWHGVDTGFAAFRHRLLAMTRSYAIPPRFDSWPSFRAFGDHARRAGMFPTWRDMHWDLRPRPDFGTLELRVMDAPSSLDDAIGLVALARHAMRHVQEGRPWPDDLPGPLAWWFEKENHFRASRDGLEAVLVWDERGATRPVRDVLASLLDAVRPVAEALGEGRDLERAAALGVEDGASTQRRLVAEGRGPQALVRALVDALRPPVRA